MKLAQITEIGANVLEIPYIDENVSMIVILPDEGTDFQQVETNLEKFDFQQIIKVLNEVHTIFVICRRLSAISQICKKLDLESIL